MAADTHGKAKILIVDDEKLIRLTLSAKLKKVGYYTVAVDGVESAVAEFKKNPDSFSAVITDIMMGDMDGFMFRDIIRGFDPTVPIFFLTALDPEEGGGFLKKILDDPISYYLPKAVPTNVLLKRIRQVVASHRVEMFIQNKMDEDRKSLELAAHIQRSLLPIRAMQTPRGFYSIYWRPADIVSGDLIEAIRYGSGSYLYVLGDIQGHGTSAALAMTAVQSFLKNLLRSDGAPLMTPDMIANMIQSFFRANLAEVSYMTVLICIHRWNSAVDILRSAGPHRRRERGGPADKPREEGRGPDRVVPRHGLHCERRGGDLVVARGDMHRLHRRTLRHFARRVRRGAAAPADFAKDTPRDRPVGQAGGLAYVCAP